MKLPRVYPILDLALLSSRGVPVVEAAEALLEAGARLIQLRSKTHLSREALEQGESIAALCKQAAATLIVNDRADLAMLLDAGVHVGQDDLPPMHVRSIIGPGRLLGFSTHNEVQIRQGDLEPVDYLALGPIFGTSNKINPDPVVGTCELSRLRAMTKKPIVGIGGITRENARHVWAAGADSVAVIGDIYPAVCSKNAIRDRFKEWLMAAQDE
jgi:thiamine-phosphate pyrophosphorylase